MPLYLLGFSRSADTWRCDGVHGVVLGALAAAVWSGPSSPTPREHAAQLAAIHRQVDVLPMRFGVVLPDAEAVHNLLRRQQESLLQDLDRLKGTAEIGVRIALPQGRLPPTSPLPSGSSGPDSSPAQYLATRRARYRWQDQLGRCAQLAAESCTAALKDLYRNGRRLSPEPPGTVRLAFLVERSLSEAVARRLGVLEAQRPGEHYTIVGPWPPYSFV